MTEDSLTKLYSTFLATFNEQSFRPCRLFIVTASFKKGLKTCHVTEDTPEKAWSAAVEALKKIRGEVVRVEFVNACRRVTWAECLEEMRSDSANHFPHGIAFDEDWQIVFTEQELNELLTPTNHASFDVTKFQKYCRFHLGCTFPNISETDEVEIFDTTKIFFQEGMSEPSTDIPPLRVGVLVNASVLGNNRNLSQISSLNLMAYMARQFNIELYFFTSQDFNPENKTVQAKLIDGNKSVEKIIPLPKIVYNDFDFFKGEKRMEIKSLIKKETYFVCKGISMTKKKIYDLLIADGKFKKFLIESHEIKSFEHFLSLLEQYGNDVVLKPIRGMQGTGVNEITFTEKGYIVTNDKIGKVFLKEIDEFKNYYKENFTQGKYILQPYFASRTKDGKSFDIRVHVRRGAEGKFKVFPYPRISGTPEGILSNISAGGHTMPILKFLKHEFGDDCKMLYNQLMDLGNNFPKHFQSLLPKMITSMGLDVGIHRSGSSYDLKLFEVNISGPGTGAIPMEAAFANLEYLQYLGKCLREGKLQNQ